MSPQRIQLRRSKGWRKPEGAVVVSRPSRWGNPFRIDEPYRFTWADGRVGMGICWGHASAVRLFESYLEAHPELCEEIRAELAGRDLACWCPLEDKLGNRVPCHADVLLRVANPEVPS